MAEQRRLIKEYDISDEVPVTLNPVSAETSAAEKELTQTLAFKLNDQIQHAYVYWCHRLGFIVDSFKNEGYEFAELIGRLYNQYGKKGLSKLYALLQQDNELACIDLIDQSPASILFK